MQKLLVLSTGGTLDKVYFDALSEFQVGEPVVADILASMNVTFDFTVQEVCRKDSLEIAHKDRLKMLEMVNATDAQHILITHGTDSMVDSAQFLGEQSHKVIIFAGAMQPHAFKDSDASFNIGCAVGAMGIAKPGVYIAMSGQIHRCGQVFKNYESRRFERLPVS
ncbi:MAG: asparaginase domain-containing protein [Bermanella sp.]